MLYLVCLLSLVIICQWLANAKLRDELSAWEGQYWAAQDTIDQLEEVLEAGSDPGMPLEPAEKPATGIRELG